MKEGGLFVLFCFICLSHWEISQTKAALLVIILDDTVGKPWMSTSAPSWFCDVSTYGGEKLLNIENFFSWKFIQIKTKNYRRNLGIALGIVGKPFDKWGLFFKVSHSKIN